MRRVYFLLMFMTIPLMAAQWTNRNCCWDGFFNFGAEAIWWKPCACAFNYGTLTTFESLEDAIASDISSEHVKPSYDWGFRIFGGFENRCDCFFGLIDGTYYRSTASSNFQRDNSFQVIVPPFVATTGNAALNATGRLRYQYTRVNLRLGYYLHKGCFSEFYSYGGLRYVHIKQSRRINSGLVVGGFERQENHAKFDGAALEFGVGGEFAVLCGFNIVGHAGILAALGDQRLGGSYETNMPDDITTLIKSKAITRCLPGVELRLGVNYAYCCGCFELVGEIGYELDHYFGVLTVFDLSSVSQAGSESEGTRVSLPTTCTDVGFGGPYVSLALYF